MSRWQKQKQKQQKQKQWQTQQKQKTKAAKAKAMAKAAKAKAAKAKAKGKAIKENKSQIKKNQFPKKIPLHDKSSDCLCVCVHAAQFLPESPCESFFSKTKGFFQLFV